MHASIFSYFFPIDPICSKCRTQFSVLNKVIELKGYKIKGLYKYNSYFSTYLIQYKECMDEVLYSIFLFPFINELKKKYKNSVFVEIPSSESKYENRGFHHIQKIFSSLSIPCLDIFYKQETVQKHKTKKEREKISSFIQLKKDIDLRNHNIVLIDDVCTTGETMLACFRLLEDKVKTVEGLVLAIHPLMLSNFVDEKSLK